ncbi:MAG: hypothetical protein AAGB23_09350 [Pseudomonadota bacterium]
MPSVRIMGLIGLSAALALSGCAEEASAPSAPEAVEQGGVAEGDVKPGTISDAMLPLESLQSQAPSVQRRTTEVTTEVSEDGESVEATVETTTVTQSLDAGTPSVAEPLVPQIAPPIPPAPPPSDDGGADEGEGGAR